MPNPSMLDQDNTARPDSQTTNEPNESFGDNGIPGLSPFGRFDTNFERFAQGSRNWRN